MNIFSGHMLSNVGLSTHLLTDMTEYLEHDLSYPIAGGLTDL